MAFLEELKQRKVVRVAVAYLVVAWLGVQVASIALPAFDAPAWVLRVLILVIALGFPLALVLAWAVDLTPEGPRFVPGGTGWKRLIAISAAIGALALGWYVFGQPAYRSRPDAQLTSAGARERPSAAATPSTAASNPNDRSIAVLPFVNMSRDPANEYFSDGLAETTLDMLAQVHDLRVIARTSSFAFKGKAQDVRAIGRALDAAHLLEGSVQQAGNTVRITAQLVRTRDGAHLWSHKYDRQLTDVFAIQDEIAGEVVKALQLALPAAERKRLTQHGTQNLAAYQEFLRGTPLLPERNVPKMRQALVHFEKAIALDPAYAAAYAQAAITLGLLRSYSGELTPSETERLPRYVATALRLDPGLGEAHAAQAMLHERDKDIEAAVASYQRTVELAPNYASGLQWYAEFLMRTIGDLDRALPMFARAVAIDPLSPEVRNEYITALAAAGREDEALAMNAAQIRANPGFANAHNTRADIFEARGDLVGALRELAEAARVDPAAGNRRSDRCNKLLNFSAVAEAEACVAALRSPPVAPERMAGLRAALLSVRGDKEGAMALLIAQPGIDPWNKADVLLGAGHDKEALAMLRALEPEMFRSPPEVSSYPGDAVMGAQALKGAGEVEQARALAHFGLRANEKIPVKGLVFGKHWTDAMAWAVLDDVPRACAALRATVADGFFLRIAGLENDRIMATVRRDPCFAAALAPAKARAAAQVAAARKAGLL